MVFAQIVRDGDLTVIETTFQVVNERFKKGTGKMHREAIDRVSKRAHANFIRSIERAGTSATIQGTSYRPEDRATGRFTFGKGRTFTGSLLRNLGSNISGFGYPNVPRADAATDGAWRALEFGRPAFRMPMGFWRAPDGRRARTRSPGGDIFIPGGAGEQLAKGIEPKLFITEAFEKVVREYVEPEYQRIADKAARGS